MEPQKLTVTGDISKNRVGAQLPSEAPHVFISYRPNPGGVYQVHLDEGISLASKYRDLKHLLRNASESDTFEIYLNGPGGHLSTCIELVHEIANTKGRVVGHLTGEAQSAHANIFMACHEHVVYPYSLLMVHTFSGGFYAKGEDVTRAAKAYNELTRTCYTDLYTGFLSDEELEDVLRNNHDRYYIGQEILDRLAGTYAHREKLAQEADEQAQEAMQEALKTLENVQSGPNDVAPPEQPESPDEEQENGE
ncbi:ATP-dependent Clp protease proteolytic subunit [Vibrio phage vB_ValS_X1]|uniref:ATP-dependent Clp protease proteolytic subunit n=1 Tax=Vibrio phage vB_ValS_X1 TaxID=2736341 RepID=A0A6M9Z9H6_9CAUD|nr:ATP-dependent Clp protease proteolytic subunit [Vibrio phage vB_ValS_X1]